MKKKKRVKSLTALLLGFILCFNVFPAMVFAAESYDLKATENVFEVQSEEISELLQDENLETQISDYSVDDETAEVIIEEQSVQAYKDLEQNTVVEEVVEQYNVDFY